MAVRSEQQKHAVIETAAGLAASRLGARASLVQRFLAQFYDRVAPADLVERTPDDLYGAAVSLWQFAQTRMPGKAKLRVFNPRGDEQGWRSERTVIEIVNDDMPFLVDSASMALHAEGVTVHLVIHPILSVERDEAGRLTGLGDGDHPVGRTESFMHVEIGEIHDQARLDAVATRLKAVFEETRAAVEDWRRMRDKLAELRRDIAAHRAPLSAEEIAETVDFLSWLDDDNFTFLGSRDYRFAQPSTAEMGSGLGILRDPAYRVFDGLRDFAALPPDVQAFLRAPRLLFISKSNRRARIHRPVRMDTIGVKLFDAQGTAVGMQLFVGLFTSQALTQSPRQVPFLRHKVANVLTRSGFAPASHDGKALAHILETFPRDELFQIPRSELYDIAIGILGLQERQRIALFARRDPFGRFVSCFVYVPRERYDTALRQSFAAILEAAFHAKVDSFSTLLDEAVLARVYFVLRAEAALPEVDLDALERRLVEAGRNWGDKLPKRLLPSAARSAAANSPCAMPRLSPRPIASAIRSRPRLLISSALRKCVVGRRWRSASIAPPKPSRANCASRFAVPARLAPSQKFCRCSRI